jgi:hypothetical protein
VDKAWTSLGIALALAAAGAQAGTYKVLQEADCPVVSAGELAQVVRKAGAASGLDLPKDMALRTEVRCAQDREAKGKEVRYVYTVRASIDKQLSDGEHLRWAPVVQHTGYGTARGGAALLREVGFTVRDLVRQEP